MKKKTLLSLPPLQQDLIKATLGNPKWDSLVDNIIKRKLYAKKKKQADMQSDNIEMSGWNKNALDYGNTHELNRIADSWKGVSNQLNRIEVKLDHILARLDGGLK